MHKGIQIIVITALIVFLVILGGLFVYLIPFSLNEYSKQQVAYQLEELCGEKYVSISEIQLQLDKNADPNVYKFMPPAFLLMDSIQRESSKDVIDKRVEQISKLVEAGANICEDNTYRSLILMATNCENEEVLSSLLNIEGVSQYVNVTNSYNQTPLMLAVKQGRIESVKLLLNAGANKNILDVNHHTALYYAKVTSNSAVIQLLSDKRKG